MKTHYTAYRQRVSDGTEWVTIAHYQCGKASVVANTPDPGRPVDCKRCLALAKKRTERQ